MTAVPVGPLGTNGWYVRNVSRTWKVSDPGSAITAPAVAVTTSQAGASYEQGAHVPAAYSCSDGRSGIATCAGPVAPVIPNQSATEGVSFQFTAPQFTDPRGQGLTYVYSGLPGWLTVPYPAQNPRYSSGRAPAGAGGRPGVHGDADRHRSAGASANDTFLVRVRAP